MTSEARDIVERLRKRKAFASSDWQNYVKVCVPDADCQEAASLIERQAGEIERLREDVMRLERHIIGHRPIDAASRNTLSPTGD